MDARAQPWWMALAGLGGGMLIAVAQSSLGGGFTPAVGVAGPDLFYGTDLYTPMTPVAVTVLALFLVRWWPYLLAAGGLVCVVIAWPQLVTDPPVLMFYYQHAVAFPLLVIGVLGAAQRLLDTGAARLGAIVAGLAIGFGFFGAALHNVGYQNPNTALHSWQVLLVVLGLAAVTPALRWGMSGDRAWSWQLLRPAVAGGLVVLVAMLFAMLGTERLAELFGVSYRTLAIYPNAKSAIVGGLTLAVAVLLVLIAGLWPLAGTLTAGLTQLAVTVPLTIALAATVDSLAERGTAVLAGIAIGAAGAATRHRMAAAVALTIGAATSVLVAHSATSGQPMKLAGQYGLIPSLFIIALTCAAATAAIGATAPVLAPRGAVPAVLGPIVSVFAVAGLGITPVFDGGARDQGRLYAPIPLDVAGVLLLAGAAAIGGLGVAHHITSRWASRKQAELIRLEAAAAERDRLARPIHDGVLQVLAMVQREGSELGGTGAQLAALAGEQEVALRNLLSGNATTPGGERSADLRGRLNALASPAVEFSGPVDPVPLPAATTAEILAAVGAALDNVRQHAGPSARAWILLEDEDDAVRITIRDDGPGFDPDRLRVAARSGRLGVEQSIRGRISDLGGTTTITSRPGIGTEVELWVPR
ncbi:sensor histidine kinase [Dactylosporangium matsuzakiense]|nr:ATP-binding protein [Dactylosporangium matsuzakiense]